MSNQVSQLPCCFPLLGFFGFLRPNQPQNLVQDPPNNRPFLEGINTTGVDGQRGTSETDLRQAPDNGETAHRRRSQPIPISHQAESQSSSPTASIADRIEIAASQTKRLSIELNNEHLRLAARTAASSFLAHEPTPLILVRVHTERNDLTGIDITEFVDPVLYNAIRSALDRINLFAPICFTPINATPNPDQSPCDYSQNTTRSTTPLPFGSIS